MTDGSGKVSCIGGSSHLVEDYIDSLARSGEVDHCLHEVLPVGAVEPSCADDDVLATGMDDGLLTSELGNSIYTGGCCFTVLVTRSVVIVSSEDVIGGYVNDCGIESVCSLSEISNGNVVDVVGIKGFAFGCIDVGIGGAIDDYIDVLALHDVVYSSAIGNIELGYIGEDVVVRGVVRDVTYGSP